MLRMIIMFNHFMVFVSSVIVTGLVSYFLARDPYRSAHLIFQEVIAVITLLFWMFGTFLPLVDRYGGYLMPANLIMSYLWLTSFIFSAQDWSGNRCWYTGPRSGNCGRKHTIEAFNFIALFFLLSNTVAEAILMRSRVDKIAVKDGVPGRRTDNMASAV
ncbi:hypothetical protein HIM_09105 [Hirsutella minnesotensis 3608]|uniref:MARVEL domain-containing protein n=1 Tax=Hirsutella minnesotensis 3608 TaxID=1043627 RepID=A0A0F7ZXY2_9HYPO|nr:hypothetical protein HIM_09105 [Hirsutella minnesotensis 3608]